ncbi:MAG: hypothetical protein N2252_04780 [Candidatus Kryptonium sp.]|nr:hypothetical protein [Candidatus Kryptonium sp.]
MSVPFSLYEKLEKKFGRDEAVEITKMIEDFINEMKHRAETIGIEKKFELKDELTKELASKADVVLVRTELESRIENVRVELQNTRIDLERQIENVRSELQSTRAELDTKIESVRAELQTARAELDAKIENVRAELQTVKTELKSEIDRLNLKLNFLIILVIIVLTLMNPIVAEIVKKWAGIN